MHSLRAIICKNEVADSIADNWIYANSINLNQNFSMILLVKKLFDDITELINCNEILDYGEFFQFFNSSINEFLKFESRQNMIAYIEIDYFDEISSQSSVLYKNGCMLDNPIKSYKFNCVDNSIVENQESAINFALRSLGVVRENNKDELQSLGLDKYRRMD